ncbi:MAG: virulence RhuM family protein [Methanobrevibacter sp. CfCl-M3]
MEEVKLTETLLYIGDEGAVTIEVIIDHKNETLWATQKTMTELFCVNVRTINEHLQNIFKTDELDESSTIRNFRIVQNEGNRSVKRKVNFYNLDAIIAVGYRVNSKQGTQFRIWATHILKDYMVKGYVLDKELLKNDGRFGTIYFEKLLEDIREIRASERKFNQKITDIYATSSDYNPKAKITRKFFATVQNKILYAVTGFTAAEIISNRCDSEKPNMGLTSWRKENGKILLSDVVISKNYLNKKELDNLNRIVEAFLNVAEFRANNQIITTMNDWKDFLDNFIELNQLPVLFDKGSIDSDSAKQIAISEYEKFRVIQDSEFHSDFDKMIDEIKRIEGGNL